MKFLLVLATSSVLAWLFSELLNIHAPKGLLGYVAWLWASTLVFFIIAQKVDPRHPHYAHLFIAGLVPLFCMVLYFSVRFCLSMPTMEFAFMCFAGAACWNLFLVVLMRHYILLFGKAKVLSLASEVVLTQAWVYSVCGAIAFASLATPMSELEYRCRLGLAVWATAIGAYSFCESLGIVRSEALWRQIGSYAPQLIGLVCFLFFVFLVRGYQREMSREAIRGQHVEMAAIYEEAGQ